MLQLLIVKADRLAGEAMGHYLRAIFPSANCFVVQRIDDARAM
jgi:hypothetical protein